MTNKTTTQKDEQPIYVCPVCFLKYREKKWADACEKWCRDNNTCSVEICSHAVHDEAQ
jgi:hypothetical protein